MSIRGIDLRGAIPNGAWMAGDDRQKAIVANSMKKQGMRPDVPDPVIVLPSGRAAWAELKSPEGVLSEAQQVWRDQLIKLGHKWRLRHASAIWRR